MATHGEIQWPPVGRINGRLRGELHGRRHSSSTPSKMRLRAACEGFGPGLQKGGRALLLDAPSSTLSTRLDPPDLARHDIDGENPALARLSGILNSDMPGIGSNHQPDKALLGVWDGLLGLEE